MSQHRLRASLAVVLALTLVATFASDHLVRATGCWSCVGSDGNQWPLAFTSVVLMDSDCLGSTLCDDVMGRADTDAAGCFVLEGKGGDPGNWSWSKPDLTSSPSASRTSRSASCGAT